MEVRRPVRVELDVPESDADLLPETIVEYRDAAKDVGFTRLRRLPEPSVGDAPVGVGVTTGALNTIGFDPAPALVRLGVHGESSTR